MVGIAAENDGRCVMWNVPPVLIAGDLANVVQTITMDTDIGNLFDFLGQPGGVRNVSITVDGADVGNILITTEWALGSTFEFIAINGGRFLGDGGDAGAGGADFGATGEAGLPGQDGGHAITNQGTYPVSIDVDDGFLFGGGGGGGGGSYTDTGTGGDAGGGGGGGQGYNGGAAGAGGSPSIGIPPPTPGSPGTRFNNGLGGIAGGFTDVDGGGGDGGGFGLGGRTGRSSNIIQGVGGFGSFFYYGGLGGNAGRAYSGSNLTLSGVDDEATLRAAGRILGETGPDYLTVPGFSFNFFGFDIQPTNDNIGISFQSGGATLEINTTGAPPTPSTLYYLTGGTGTGANYQVRTSGRTNDSDPSYWDTGAGAGVWQTISVLRQYFENYTASGTAAHLMEMRRSDIPGVGADDVMASFYVKVSMESEP